MPHSPLGDIAPATEPKGTPIDVSTTVSSDGAPSFRITLTGKEFRLLYQSDLVFADAKTGSVIRWPAATPPGSAEFGSYVEDSASSLGVDPSALGIGGAELVVDVTNLILIRGLLSAGLADLGADFDELLLFPRADAEKMLEVLDRARTL